MPTYIPIGIVVGVRIGSTRTVVSRAVMISLTVRAGGCHIVAAVSASTPLSRSAWHDGDSLI